MDQKRKRILNNLGNTYCRLKPSKIDGVGVFAISNLPKGINPFIGSPKPKWYEFTMDEIQGLDQEILKMIDDFFVIEKDNTVYIPETGLNGMDLSFFPNHSLKPNLKAVYNKNQEIGFVTNRRIKKGEELTADYSFYDDKYKK